MELWFWAAVGGAICSGFANFIFKIAAKRDYHAGQFSFFGGLFSVTVTTPLVLLFSNLATLPVLACIAALGAGLLGGFNNIAKVKALQYIDTTIYFPIFKLVSPILAIMFGLVFFAERFTLIEWIGLAMGVFVPLMLITPGEQKRQNNLALGLVLVGFTALFAASGSVLNKYSIMVLGDVVLVLTLMSLGIIVGSIIAEWYKGGVPATKKLFGLQGDRNFILLAIARSVLITIGVALIIFAFGNGGSLGVVHTINSMYILIPIVLAIIFYGEHWNLQKVIAIVLSVASLALLG